MSVRDLSLPVGRVVLTLGLVIASVLGGAALHSSSAATFSARAGVDPNVQYLGDAPGTTFTFTVENTGTTDSIGAVEIDRPGKTWVITGCPAAPAGWTVSRSDTMCRFRSAATPADDIQPGTSSSAFQVTAYAPAGRQSTAGTWGVLVSRSDAFDRPSRMSAAAATPPGLGVTAYSFEVLDVVVDPETSTPGLACPPPSRTATAGSTGHTLVVCGRNRTTGTLIPTAAQSSLAGTFVASHGAFSSAAVAPSSTSRILGSWSNVTIGAAGTNKTVLSKIGSASNRTSPVTTLEDYEATTPANESPAAHDDTRTVAEGDGATVVDVLANDTDPDGDTLAVTAIDTTGTLGSVTNNGTDVTYDPNGAFDSLGTGESTTDTFTYTVSDGHGGVDTATVTVTITGENDPPAAHDDSKTVAENSSTTTIDVLGNDTDPDGDSLAISAVDTTGTLGSVTNNGTDVTYDPNGAFDSLGTGETATDTFTYTASDGHGGTDTATVTITVTGVAAANHPPTAVDDGATVLENDGAGTVDVLANDTDVDGDTLSVTGVDTTGTLGTLTNNGTDITYNPNSAFSALPAGGTGTDTFSYTVSDGHGGTDTATVTITVTGVNNAPSITGLEGGALAYTENDAATPVTATGTVTDVDSANLGTGTLTVDYTAGGGAADRLEIRDQGVLPGQIGLSGSTVSFGGVPIGTVTGGTGTTPLVVTFNTSATPAAAQALLRNVTFRNVSESPSTATRTVRFVLTDGDGGTSASKTRNVTVSAVDDPPVAVADSATVAQNAPATPVPVLANDTDPDGGPLAIASATDPAHGTVVLTGGSPGAATGLTYQPDAGFCGTSGPDTFGYTLNGGSSATVSITVTCAANTPPVANDDNASVGENSSGSTVTVLANDTDADSDTLSVTAVDTTGTVGTVTNNGTDVTYDPNGAFESLGAGDTATDTFTYTASDGHGGTDTATVTITVTGSNDAPVIAAVEAGSVSYAENGPGLPITATGTVTDVDSANLDTGTLTVDYTAGGSASDRLEIRNQGVLPGQIGVSGASVTYGGVPIGTVAGGSGTTPLVITLNASASPAAAQALVRNVTYRNVSDSPSTATRTVRFVLTDGDGGTSAPASRNVTVTAVNDSPVIAAVEAGALAYGANDPAAVVTATGTVTDVDSANFGTGTLTADFSAGGQAEDRLEIRHQGTAAGQIGISGADVTFGGVTIGTFTGGTGTTPLVVVLNLNATPAAAQALLRNITYRDIAASPVTAGRTVRFVLTDGDGGTSAPATRSITVSGGGNVAPLLVIPELTALAYTTGDPAVVVSPGATVTDSDSPDFATGTLTVVNAIGAQTDDRIEIQNQGTGAGQIGVSGSSVTFAGTTVGTFAGGSGATSLVVTFNASATPAVAQAVTRAVTYRNVGSAPGSSSRLLQLTVTDGDGGTSLTGSRGIDVTGPTEAPVVTTSAGSAAYVEGGSAVAIDPGLTVTDLDSDLVGMTVQITGNYDNGHDLILGASNGSVSSSFNAATGTLTLVGNAPASVYETLARVVAFTSPGDNPSGLTRTLTFVADDGTSTSDPATRTVTVAPVNDAPSVGLEAAALTYTEGDAPTPFSPAGTVADPDSADFSSGTLTVDFSAGGQAEDQLAIRNQGTGAGQIGVSGATVTYAGTTIGTFSGGTGGTPLTITLNAAATPVTTQALLRNVTYTDASSTPITTQRTIRVVLTDGDGGSSTPNSRNVTVVAVNSAPVIAAIEAGALAYTENAVATIVTATGTVTDPDSANFDTGTLTVDFSSGGQAEDRLSIRNQGTGAGAIGLTGVNVTFSGVLIGTVTGGTGTTPMVITLTSSATPAAVQALLRNVTYADVSDNPVTAARTIRFVLTDGDGGTSGAPTRTVNVSAVDDPATITTSAGSTAYTEQNPAVVVDGALTVTDVDGGTLSTATASITGPLAGDTLAFTPTASITGSFDTGTNVLTLTGSGTAADYQAVLRTVTFANPTNDAPGTSRAIRFQVASPLSFVATKSIAITQVNDPPVVSLDTSAGSPYAEQAGFQNLFGPATSITDPDSTTLSSVTVTLGAGFDAAFDTLRVNPAVTGFTTSFTSGILTITRAGGTVAQFQDALRNVQFANTSDDPDHRNDGTANPADADRSVSVVANDGGAASAAQPRSLTITPVNDAPGAPAVLPSTTGVRNTTLVAGTTTTEPNVARTVALIGTSVDPDGLESAITVVPVSAAATAQNGRITLTGPGALKYEPPASTTLAADTFGYQLTDGTTASAPITFTVTLSGVVWYVADQAPLPQDGTAARPFDTVTAAETVAAANQTIHVRRAPGDGVLTGAVTLKSGQRLIGEGVALTSTDVGSATAETIAAAGTKPVLTATGADVVTLAANTQVAGVSINPDGAGGGIFGTNVAGVTLRSMDVTDTGVAATQPGVEITGAGNGLAFTAPVSLSTTQAGALSVTGAALSGTIASTSVTGSTASPGVSLTTTTGSLAFTTMAVTTSGQPGFVLSNATGIAVAAGTVAATSRPAVDATGLSAGTTLAFTSVSSTNSTSDGVNLDGTDTGWTFSAGAGAISGATTIGFDVNNGTGAVSYGGSIASTTGKTADVSSRAASTTFSGNLTGTGTGIIVTGNSAGTTTFSGATKTLSTGASNALDLTANTGSTTAFTNGGLTVTTTSGTGLNATGGGTLTVSGTGNTITTGTGIGVNINATTIGTGNVTLQKVSSTGAPSGIVLTSTGTSGSFSVTGTGAAASGGTIANTTGPGISLNDGNNVSLNNMALSGTDRSGVQGRLVSGFAFTNGTITNAGDTHVNDNDSSIAFNDTVGGMTNNVDGAVTITGNTLSNAFGGGVDIFQYAGTISNAVITGNTISSSADPALSKRSGIAMNLFGSTTTVASLTTGNLSNNTVTGFPSGDGISIQGANTASATAPAGTYGSTAAPVLMSGNQVIGDATNKVNGFGVAASVTGRGSGAFSLTNNGTVASPLRNMKSSAVAIGGAGDVTIKFVVTGNVMTPNNGFGSSGLALGTDKNIQADLSTLTHPNINATINNNSVSNTDGTGIRILHRDSLGTLNLRLENNTVTNVLGGLLLSGIRVENGSSGAAGFGSVMCANISGNSATSGPVDAGDKNSGINLYNRDATVPAFTFGIVGLSPNPATAAQTETFVANLNPLSAAGQGFFAPKKVWVRAGTTFRACTLPAGM
ncbi:MAG: tandem-95 repeat protein [Nocardioidaceae bacterium]|nr:tandem-95 repeat protein [Nocardioidaceae bacterium]